MNFRLAGPPTPFEGSIKLPDESATVTLGQDLGAVSANGDIILLGGDLGAGKTTLARGLIQGLTGAGTEVPSPTFTLVQDYESPAGLIHHFDLYRIEHEDELLEIGLEDALADGICLIEWPDRLGTRRPPDALTVELRGSGARIACLSARFGNWRARLASNLLWDTLTVSDDAAAS